MKLKALVIILLAFALLLGLSALVFAQDSDPQVLFTDNIDATSTTTAVTEMEQELLDRLNAATTSIDLAIYSFNRVSIREALKDAEDRGVDVRVVTDNAEYENPNSNPHFRDLETAGIPVVRDGLSSLMHNKFFVIDGLIVWTGSTNMTDRGFTYNHNNSMVFTSPELADIYTTEFEEMFVSSLFGTAKDDNTTHTLTCDGSLLESYFSPTDGAMSQVIGEVNAADESIYFSIFSFTDDSLRDAIIARAQAGVTVRGIFDNTNAGGPYAEYEALCNAGIPNKREDFRGFMHNKFMVVDVNGTDPVVVAGSMNWSDSGANDNDENTLIFHDPGVAQAYHDEWQQLWSAIALENMCNPFRTYVPVVLKMR